MSLPVVRFLLCFAATVPVSWAWRLLPWAWLRHAYAASTGLFLTYAAFGWQALLLCGAPIIASYSAMLLFRRRAGVITFALAFSFLVACHVRYMSGDAWKNGGIDATGALMVLTLKVIATAMNYQDGQELQVAPLEPGSGKGDEQLRRSSSGSSSSKERVIAALPSPLAYLGYCVSCGTHLAGPVYEFQDYSRWTNRQGLWDPGLQQPSPVGPALRAVAKAAACMLTFLYLSPLFPPAVLTSAAFREEWPLWKRLAVLWTCGLTARWKYYFIWSVSEAALILGGLGFSGRSADGSPRWNRAQNVDILKVELAGSGAQIPLFWNIHVGNWLRFYVYERLTPRGAKPGFLQLLCTQVVSAVWHGLYTGYVLFFVHTALMIAASRVIYKWQLVLASTGADGTTNRFTRALAWLVGAGFASFVLHYSMSGFLLLNVSETLAAYKSLHFSGTVLPILVIVSSYVVKPPSRTVTINRKKQ